MKFLDCRSVSPDWRVMPLDYRAISIVEFAIDKAFPYAILSHTWGQHEVSFKEIGTPAAMSKPGWIKICYTCIQARINKLDYAWIDTCCIDKDSSAELSEAINSMFELYERSARCYAFLQDCNTQVNCLNNTFPLASTRWMARGWTLQELIAPPTVEFFDCFWQRLNTRQDLSLVINQITGISREILERNGGENIEDLLQRVPVCQKMHWASGRETTRVEDMAYCLIGLFGINMSPIYGEGSKAFTRLQEEIIKHNNDLTIFAWRAAGASKYHIMTIVSPEGQTGTGQPTGVEAVRGLLAESPREFQNTRHTQPVATTYNPEYAATNKGIRISSIHVQPKDNSSDLLMDLSCFDKGEGTNRTLCVVIRHIGGGEFVRMEPQELYLRSSSIQDKKVFPADLYLAMSVRPTTFAFLQDLLNGAIRTPKMAGSLFYRQHVAPRLQLQDDDYGLFITHGFPNAIGYATYCYRIPESEEQGYEYDYDDEDQYEYEYEDQYEPEPERCDIVVFFGLGEGKTRGNPWCFITTPDFYSDWRHDWWAVEENFRRHSIRAQNRDRECDVTIKGSAGNSTYHVRGTFTSVDRWWDLNLEVVEKKEGLRPRRGKGKSVQIPLHIKNGIKETRR